MNFFFIFFFFGWADSLSRIHGHTCSTNHPTTGGGGGGWSTHACPSAPPQACEALAAAVHRWREPAGLAMLRGLLSALAAAAARAGGCKGERGKVQHALAQAQAHVQARGREGRARAVDSCTLPRSPCLWRCLLPLRLVPAPEPAIPGSPRTCTLARPSLLVGPSPIPFFHQSHPGRWSMC